MGQTQRSLEHFSIGKDLMAREMIMAYAILKKAAGELRRLAIARALLGDALLILADEPTADLDGVTADEVRSALLDAARGKTLIVATHDADLAGRMDRIVTLCEGSVEEIAS